MTKLIKRIIKSICIKLYGEYKGIENFNPFVLPTKREKFLSKIIFWTEK